MSVIIVNTLSGQTNGTVNVPDYTIELTAITTAITALNTSLTAQLVALNLGITNNFSPVGVPILGTPAASMNAQAKAVNNLSSMTASIMTSMSEINANLSAVQTSIAQLSAQVSHGVTTQQVAVADQIKNNQFQQVTTNAALERSNLPPTAVQPAEVTAQIKSTVDTVLPLKTSIATAGLVEQGISDALSNSQQYVVGIVRDSFIGSYASTAATTVKGWLGIKEPDIVAKRASAEASALAAKSQLGV